MGWFSKLFGRRTESNLSDLLLKAWEDAEKPRGAYEAALDAAKLRDRLYTLVEEFEVDGKLAYGMATAEEVLLVNPEFFKLIQRQPDAILLEPAFRLCISSRDLRAKFNDAWPSCINRYIGISNSEDQLKVKSVLLARFLIINIDISELTRITEKEISEDCQYAALVEVAALFYRLIDELAFRFLKSKKDFFMSFFEDDLATVLALRGSSPGQISTVLADRSREYALYREWIPADGVGAKGTLLWEASKHVEEAIGEKKDSILLPMSIGSWVLDILNNACVGELLTGNPR